MKQESATISASQVIQDCRDGTTQSDEFYRRVNSVAPVTALRNLIEPQDATWIDAMLDSGSTAQKKFALDLTKPLANNLLVAQRLRQMWGHEQDPLVRQSLLFALLNVEQLDEAIRRRIFDWMKENWDAFLESVTNWYGGKDRILDLIKQRADDPSFIKAKHWIYLCCAVASGQHAERRKFITSLPGDQTKFTEEVRQFALAQL